VGDTASGDQDQHHGYGEGGEARTGASALEVPVCDEVGFFGGATSFDFTGESFESLRKVKR
jgi:hypothetical protein